MSNNFTARSISNAELDEMYGNHLRYKIGDCYMTKDNRHFYMQMENHILHICDNDLICFNHNSILDEKDIIKISNNVFESKLKETIFNLGIYKYCR